MNDKLRTIVKSLKRGETVEDIVDLERIIFTPLKKAGLNYGDRVLCYNRGRLGIHSIVDCEASNALPRYKLSSGKWVGKTKIFGLVMPILDNAAEALTELGNQFFLTCLPETPDFTNSERPAKLVIMSEKTKIEVPLPKSSKDFMEVVANLNWYLPKSTNIILGWEIKGLLSYLSGRLDVPFRLRGKILDLKVMEHFLGIEKPCPLSYAEAKKRLADIVRTDSWDAVKRVYDAVHLPLIREVIPTLEVNGLPHGEIGAKVHGCYEIEGQANGRLRCSKAFTRGYNPHSMDKNFRQRLRPYTDGWSFLYYDFHHMEVTTLQWLTQDPVLGELLDGGKDIYCGIWEKLTTLKCDSKFRKVCKNLFLPVIYGQGIKSVAERAGCSESTAEKLHSGIYKTYNRATEWIKAQQANLDKDHFVTDCFGRRRRFTDKLYRIRNFAVQAPAAIICLHKLIKLHSILQSEKLNTKARLVLHQHDGYCIVADDRNWKKVHKIVLETLEAEEELYPGLRLKVSCHRGKTLNDLEPFELGGRADEDVAT